MLKQIADALGLPKGNDRVFQFKVAILEKAMPAESAVIFGDMWKWEELFDSPASSISSIVASPSKSSADLILRHIGVAEWLEIAIRSADMPVDYLDHTRASWLIKV